MRNLPQHIENQLFRVLNNEIGIKAFEKWVYETEELETVLSAENYLDLIAFNFNQINAFDSLYDLFIEIIDIPKFETYRIIYLLDLVINKHDLWIKAVSDLYHEFIESYAFLEVFSGLDELIVNDYVYGVPIAEIYLSSKEEAIKMKNWLIDDTIVIKGREGHRKGTNYIDNRKEDEK
jgi:hypothetical protein